MAEVTLPPLAPGFSAPTPLGGGWHCGMQAWRATSPSAGAFGDLPRSRAAFPLCREPLHIRFVPAPRLLLAGQERVGLLQDERVRAALPPGHVGNGQFGGVDPGVDVLPALLGERPLEGASALVLGEHAEGVAQVACAAARW